MKIIFLDIDGVMNSTNEMLELLKQNPENRSDVSLPSPTKCKLLRQLVEETGAEIVLSSSWRLSLNAIQKVIDIFKPYDLRLDGFTCEHVTKSTFRGTKYYDIKPSHSHKCYDYKEPNNEGIMIEDRGAEIAYWLTTHPQVEKFIILDDEKSDIIQWFPNNLIKTNMEFGLTEKEVTEGIKILGGK